MNKRGIGKSSEDYLESMLKLREENGYIRAVDVAEDLGVSKPSVSTAVKHLRQDGYIELNHSNFIAILHFHACIINSCSLNLAHILIKHRLFRQIKVFVVTKNSNFIFLTESGEEIAQKIYTRHKTLTKFFTSLGVDPKIAAEDACLIEHDISEETFEALCRHAMTGVLPEDGASSNQADTGSE